MTKKEKTPIKKAKSKQNCHEKVKKTANNTPTSPVE